MRVILIPVLLIVWIISNGQPVKVSGIITDANTDKALPYANVMLLNKPIGTSSNPNGYYELILADSLLNDSVIFSYVGYQKNTSCIKNIRNVNIQLIPTKFKLKEIVVKPKKTGTKEKALNEFKRRKCFVKYTPVNNDSSGLWIPYRPVEPTIEALYFPYRDEYKETRNLKEVLVKVSNYSRLPIYFNLHLYDLAENMGPGNDILSNPVIVEVYETKKPITVNLEKYNLVIPDNGIYVGFELLIIDDNKSVATDRYGNTFELYSPYLNFVKVKEETIYWVYSMGKWSKTSRVDPHLFKKDAKTYSRPAISLILSD